MNWRAVRATAVSLLLAACCGQARAADYALDDVEMVSPVVVYRAKKIELIGATLSREDALKLLAKDATATGAERVAQIDAEKITIPELVSETRSGGYTQTIVYRDLVIHRVAHGVASLLDCAGATVESRQSGGVAKGRFGAFRAEGADFAAAVRMMLQPRVNADEPKRQTTAVFSMDGLDMDMADGAKVTVGKIKGANFGGRPLAAPLSGLIELSPKTEAPVGAETGRALALMAADFFTSVDVGSLEMNDIATTRAADDKAGSIALMLKRVAMNGFIDGKLAYLTVEGADSTAPDALFHIDRIALAGVDMRPLFDAATTPDRRAVPHFDSVEMSGLSLLQDGAPFSIGRLTVDAKDWQDNAPMSVAGRADHVVMPLNGAGASLAPALAALGYDRLDLSGALDFRLDPVKREFALNDLSVRDAAIGAAKLSGLLAHVSPDILSGDENLMKSALAAIVFWRADLRLENDGMLDRYVDAQAKATGVKPVAVRENLAGGARAMTRALVPAGAKADPRVDRLADATAAFLKGAKTFDLMLSAPDGLGAIDLMMAGKLGALVDRLKIDAAAH